MPLLRECKYCNTKAYDDEDLELFKKNKTCKYGRVNMCKKCNNKYNRSYKYVKDKYGIETEEYFEILNTIEACEICGKEDRTMCYDHSHITGKLRGVLCKQCNAGIGLLGDNKAGVQQALKYLEERGD